MTLPVLTADIVPFALSRGTPTKVDLPIEPAFAVGQRIRTKTIQPLGHTRLVRYARGREGVIAADLGVFTLPDTMAHGDIPSPQHVYSVSFTAQELWGPNADPLNTLRLGLWEEYLEPIEGAAS